jgi:hypothetical protein
MLSIPSRSMSRALASGPASTASKPALSIAAPRTWAKIVLNAFTTFAVGPAFWISSAADVLKPRASPE